MSKPDHPALTTLKNIKSLFCGHRIQDGPHTWLAAPTVSDTFIESLRKEWKQVRRNQVPKNFKSKNAKREALNISFMVEGIEVFPKLYTRSDYKNALLHSFFFSEARRNFCAMAYLQKEGIPTTEPLALFSGDRLHPSLETVLFTRKLEDSDIHLYEFRKQLAEKDQHTRNGFFMEFGKQMAQLHNLGIYTEDTDKNTSVRMRDNSYDLHFYDFDNFYPWRFPNVKRMTHAVLHSLFCFNYNANLEEATIFVQSYTTVRQCPELKEHFMQAVKTELAKQ